MELASIPSPPLPSGMGKTEKCSRQIQKEARTSSAPPRLAKAQSSPEVEVSAELSEASNPGSRARRETSVTQGSTEIPHFPLFCALYIPGPRQSSHCSERVEQDQDSGPSADKCDRVGIYSPKCLAIKPKREAASSLKLPDRWRRMRSSGRNPMELFMSLEHSRSGLQGQDPH